MARNKRKVSIKEVKKAILIYCEGEKTEPNYFHALCKSLNISNVEVNGCGKNTDSLVEDAIKIRKNKYSGYDQIWCVFDRDSFPAQNFNRAIQIASNNNIEVAYSNEAFELWYLLHFNYIDSALSRTLYQKKLTECLGERYEKNSKDMYEKIKGRQSTAIINSENLLISYRGTFNPENCNPCTTVHCLVEELNKWATT
jgi:hypothetical protein